MCTTFISNNHTSILSWLNENLVKDQKIYKCYENNCLQSFVLLFKFLLTALIVKNGHIYGRI